MLKRVLIIGANSYIGTSFKQFIENMDEKELIIDRISARNEEWKLHDFSGYDVVLHLSGIAHRKEKKTETADYYRVNRDLAYDVAKKAKESKVGQFIFMSTAAVYGSNVSVITKDTIPCPSTHYGMAKLEAEQDIIELHNDDFKVAVVRPPMVYGYGCKGNFKRLLLLAKITPIFPNIQNKRSMIYIDNLCEFIRLLIEYEEWGYFHPQNAEYVCTSEMVQVIIEEVGQKPHYTKVFNWLIQIFANRVEAISKLFGDWYYELGDSMQIDDYQHLADGNKDKDKPIKYQVVGFRESIKRSVSSNLG